MRVRGAHLLPRRHGRLADAAVPAAPGGAGRPRRPDHRRGGHAPGPGGVAPSSCRLGRRPPVRARRPRTERAPAAATPEHGRRGPVHDRLVRLRPRVRSAPTRRRSVQRPTRSPSSSRRSSSPRPRSGSSSRARASPWPLRARRATTSGSHVRLLAWLPHDRAWLAAATQFPGTLFFNGTTFWAITVALSNSQYDKVVWRPDFYGSILFLVSSTFAILALGRVLAWRAARGGVVGRAGST